MSNHQKQFQIAAIALLIIGIVNLLFSGVSFVLAMIGGIFHVGLKILFILSMILPLLRGLIALLCGIYGLRAAEKRELLSVAVVLGVINMVLCIFSAVGDFNLLSWILVGLAIWYMATAMNLKLGY